VPGEEFAVLVTLHNPATVETLLDLAMPIARERNGRMVAVTVVDVPRQLPIHEGLRFVHHREALPKQAQRYAQEHGARLETDVIVAHRVQDGLFTASDRHVADLLVMGWKGYTDTRERIFGEVTDQVIRHAPCDLMVLKGSDRRVFRDALFPTAGGPHAIRAAEYLGLIARQSEMPVTVCYVLSPEATDLDQVRAQKWLDQTVAHFGDGVNIVRRTEVASSVAGGIARASRDYDLVVIGAAKEPWFQKVLFGEIPERVARYSPTSVLVVKRYEGAVKSILKRVLG
jgi:nucleotide-binding universal stress UspA family protein